MTFLASLNALLAEHELAHYRDLDERHPVIHVLGLPRSGTTLGLQLIAAHTDVAYIDHIAAAFWRAPTVGLRLSRDLRRQLPHRSSYESDHGRTATLTEPHEFSYLWSSLLGLEFGLESLVQPDPDHRVDWANVKRVITNMCAVVERPLAFKSFHVIWHLQGLCQTLPRTVVVLIRREPLAVAQSLVRMRESLYGSREAWASVRPREYSWLKDEDYATQIAGQIFYVNRVIEEGCRFVPAQGLVEVTYDELCRSPRSFVDRVVEAVGLQGGEARVTSTPPTSFPRRDDQLDPGTVKELRAALASFGPDQT
jgi:Sulfotransferase family